MKSKIESRVLKVKSHLCVGLDPSMDLMEALFGGTYRSTDPIVTYAELMEKVLETCCSDVAAVKFQSAYFEVFGARGFEVLHRLLRVSSSLGYFTILDGKRGDIKATMLAYGQASFEYFGADALTVTPYMGQDVLDGVLPWVKKDPENKGVYVVWKTSNPLGARVQKSSASEVLNLVLEQPQEVKGSIGLVLGANRQDTTLSIKEAHNQPLLMPGLGAQGGAASALKGHMRPMDLAPMSRSLFGPLEGERSGPLPNLSDWVNERVVKIRESAGQLGL